MSRPSCPATYPFVVKGFVLNVFEGLCNESVVGLHSVFLFEGPKMFGEGDEGAEHSSFKAPQVLCAFLGDVPRAACPQKGLEDACRKNLDPMVNGSGCTQDVFDFVKLRPGNRLSAADFRVRIIAEGELAA